VIAISPLGRVTLGADGDGPVPTCLGDGPGARAGPEGTGPREAAVARGAAGALTADGAEGARDGGGATGPREIGPATCWAGSFPRLDVAVAGRGAPREVGGAGRGAAGAAARGAGGAGPRELCGALNAAIETGALGGDDTIGRLDKRSASRSLAGPSSRIGMTAPHLRHFIFTVRPETFSSAI
jgi:hypothetical protein